MLWVLQFKQAAHQVDAEEIADVLEVQAADAEDATEAEDEAGAEAAAEKQNLAADAKAKSAPKIIQADPEKDVRQVESHLTEQVKRPVVNAEGATKDVHEADLDLSHADSAPGALSLNGIPSVPQAKRSKGREDVLVGVTMGGSRS